MSCQCEIYEICSQCAPSSEAFLKAVRDHDEVVSRLPSPSPSYTLAEWEQLGREFSDECQAQEDSVIEGLALSKFAKWVGKKEREANDVAETSAN